MNYSDLYAGLFGPFGPLREAIEEREIIDVKYEDISDQIENDHQLSCNPIANTQPLLISNNHANSDNK